MHEDKNCEGLVRVSDGNLMSLRALIHPKIRDVVALPHASGSTLVVHD